MLKLNGFMHLYLAVYIKTKLSSMLPRHYIKKISSEEAGAHVLQVGLKKGQDFKTYSLLVLGNSFNLYLIPFNRYL